MSDFDVAGKQAGESTRTAPAWEERNTTPANLVLEGGAMRGQACLTISWSTACSATACSACRPAR